MAYAHRRNEDHSSVCHDRAAFEALELPQLPIDARGVQESYHYDLSHVTCSADGRYFAHYHSIVNEFKELPQWAATRMKINDLLDEERAVGRDPHALREWADRLYKGSFDDYAARQRAEFERDHSVVRAAIRGIEGEGGIVDPQLLVGLSKIYSLLLHDNDRSSRLHGPIADRQCSEDFRLRLILSEIHERLEDLSS